MSYVFGPVLSRRLGYSLGIDLVPYKTCSYNCIYCECGATTLLTDSVREYVSTDIVIKEIENFLKSDNKNIDWFTFSGSGEPTLADNIKDIIKYLKSRGINNIAVLTNGSLLYRDHVLNNIINSSLIIPSLDAVKEETFLKINRPYNKLRLQDIITGLIDLRKHYKGRIALEIFVIEGINTSDYEIKLFKEYIQKIRPDEVQLNSLDRPGVIKDLKKPSYDTLLKFKESLGHNNVKIVTREDSVYSHSLGIKTSTEKEIIETLKRRPLDFEDIKSLTSFPAKDLKLFVETLKGKYNIEEYLVGDKVFFRIS